MCHVSMSLIIIISKVFLFFVKIARFVRFFSASAHLYVSTPKIFRKFDEMGTITYIGQIQQTQFKKKE